MESASYGIYALVFVSEISPVRFLIRQQLVRNASVNSSCAQPPPGLLQGICPPCQSRGWGICKFCAVRGPGICHPRGLIP